MRSSRWLPRTLLFLLPLLFLSPAAALAADDTTETEYEEQARVLRVTLVKGEASLLRADGDEWESLRLNLPLVEGDRLTTGRDSRLEIQVDARNFVRLGADSTLKVVTLRDEGIAFSVTEGTATFRLARFDRDREYFEVDAPKSTMAAEKTGLYRVDVNGKGEVSVTVRDDGRARIYSESSGFVLRNNRTAKLTYYGADEADWEMSSAASFDEWDSWNDERERYLAARLRQEGRDRYYDPEVWGAEDLDAYGDWEHTRDYGYVWRPHVTIVNNYNNWAPYRYGHWRWCAPYGWTWVPDEDWGWAPYHYGRWVYVNNNWCWAPRGYGYNYGRARWRPALVAFVYVDTPHGRNLCWYPLTHGQRDPRGRFWARLNDRLTSLQSGHAAPLRRNPAFLRAVTSIHERDFGARSMRPRPAPADIAQRAINGEPVRGRLPIAPTGRTGPARFEGRANRGTPPAGGNPTAGPREGLTIVRPFPEGVPARTPRERRTGAAARTPGVPLDESLRRTRTFNNREPRVAPPALGESNTPPGGQEGTGAVTRPGRWERRPPADNPRPPRDNGGFNANPVPRDQPARTEPPKPRRDDEDPIIRTPRVRGPGRDETNRAVEQPSEQRTRPERPRDNRPDDGQPKADRPSAPPAWRTEPRPRPSERNESSSPPARRAEHPQPRREAPPPDRPERSAPPPQPRQQEPRQEAPRPSPPPRQEAPRQERPAPPPPSERPERRPARQKDNQP
ncbi:MAG TPA: DUF6600 domain-containing protein [Pyrinomonadaceae bacterium]|jgi:hypothetical protein|nr:DUF6600 domain-containing protein [Pyrinomonadaceae bacterium]